MVKLGERLALPGRARGVCQPVAGPWLRHGASTTQTSGWGTFSAPGASRLRVRTVPVAPGYVTALTRTRRER